MDIKATQLYYNFKIRSSLKYSLLGRVLLFVQSLYKKLITPSEMSTCVYALTFVLFVTVQVLLLAHSNVNLSLSRTQASNKLVKTPKGYAVEPMQCHPVPRNNDLKEAYVTLLFGNFLPGVRVLGQSLKASGTDKEMIVLIADDVSEKTQEILIDDGWTVKKLRDLPNPYPTNTGPNFLSKMLTWQMTDYRRLVYIDADAVVVFNVDELFRCGSYCVAMRHSNLFNCGVEVITPSTEMYKKFHSFIPYLDPEYQTDDQVLLNEYYKEIRYASLFNASDANYCENAMRLPAGYNSDIGMYYLNSRWKMPLEEVKIVHYTLGPLKPWKWWAVPLFDLNWKWNEIREQLKEDSEPRILTLRNWIPLVISTVILLTWRFVSRLLNRCFEATHYLSIDGNVLKFLPLLIVALSSYLTFKIIPETMTPNHAIASFVLWHTFFQFLFYTIICYNLNQVGIKNGMTYGYRRLGIYVSPKLESTLWCALSIGLILHLYYLPYYVSPFSFRIRILLYSLLYTVAAHHLIGQRLMKIWYGHEMVQTLPSTCTGVHIPDNKINVNIS